MKVCIIYDSKREKGATWHIAHWLAEEFKANGVDADTKKPREVSSFDYDIFVIGTPIYWERPMKSIVDFLKANSEKISARKVAIFIVCMAQVFGRPTQRYIKNRYLKPLEDSIGCKDIAKRIFKGWIRKPNYRLKTECIEWARKILELYGAKALQ